MPWIAILVAVALDIVAYFLMPKPKKAKPDAATQLTNPTADAGIAVPVIFGTITVTSPNVLWFGDKGLNQYEIPA